MASTNVFCFQNSQLFLFHSLKLNHISGANGPNITRGKTLQPNIRCVHCPRQTKVVMPETDQRRSANYKPNIWKDDFVNSSQKVYHKEELSIPRKEKLKEVVKNLLLDNGDIVARLEVIDNIERLGLAYLFKKEIKAALESMVFAMNSSTTQGERDDEDNLHATALWFRLLRQHGYGVSQDIFKDFMDQEGNFKESHQKHVKGMLSLFEASYLALEGESILHEAKSFTSRIWKAKCESNTANQPYVDGQANYSLGLPLHLIPPRLQARLYIDQYKRTKDANQKLLELAILDFNLAQEIHKEDLSETWRWWEDLGLASKLGFSRDRIVESFFFSMGVASEPQFRYCRKELTKIACLIMTIDDVYDIYGTLDELELFTDAIQRWEIDAISQLPHYMKLCYLTLYNTVNQLAYDTLKDKDFDIFPYLKKLWADLCKAFLVEAKWYHSGYIPTLQEYLDNALVSAGGPLFLFHVNLLQTNDIKTEELKKCLLFDEKTTNLIHWSSLILRLTDDLATSTAEIERGDVPKSIQCYMHETCVSEEVARKYIKQLLDVTWVNINQELLCNNGSTRGFSEQFVLSAVNFARMSECIFYYGDGIGVQDRETKSQVLSLLVEPVVL